MNELQEQILTDIRGIEIDCPECQSTGDDQYTCMTCGCQGGSGRINVLQWIKRHSSALADKSVKTTRETGYYWVSSTVWGKLEWVVAYWNGKSWWTCGRNVYSEDRDFDEIDERMVVRK